MNRHLRRPLKASLIALVAGIMLVVILATWIFNQDISDRKKKERASLLGGGIGGAMALVIAPFWLIAAGKIGKERRVKAAE